MSKVQVHLRNKATYQLLLVLFVFSFSSLQPAFSYRLDPITCARLLRGIPSVDTTSDIKEELHRLASNNHQGVGEESYRRFIYNDYVRIPEQQTRIKEVYCNEELGIPKNLDKINRQVNVEHTWPQSRFSRQFSKKLQKTDLHHLFLTNSKANSVRSSYEFGVVERITGDADCDDSKIGDDSAGYTVFEPPNSHKGAAARAIFYFAVRYKLQISNREETILRAWHNAYPVTAAEKFRNDKIEVLQGNRNPFIDNPSLVAAVQRFN